MSLQPVENVSTVTKEVQSDVYTAGLSDEIKFFKIPAFSSNDYLNSSLSHLTSLVSLRTTADYNKANVDVNYGGLLNTSLSTLPDSFMNQGMVGFSLPNSNYRVSFGGSNIEFKIPLNSGYSGITSGLSATTLYSSYFYSPDVLDKDFTSLCKGTVADSLKGEAFRPVTDNAGIGFKYLQGRNPNENDTNYPYFYSGVVFLFSDDVYNTFSGATGSSTSWSYQYGSPTKFANGAKMASFQASNQSPWWSGPGYDRAIGCFFLTSGFGLLWDPEVVNSLDWASAIGDPTTVTGATFSTGYTYMNATDIDLTVYLKVRMVGKPNEWAGSTNSSYIGLNKDCGIVATTFNLYDSNGECLAMVKSDDPVVKNIEDYLVYEVEFPIPGEIDYSGIQTTRGKVAP